MRKNNRKRKWYVYIFEDGYRTGVCRLSLKEISMLSVKHGELMKFFEVGEYVK